jgi:hypothetical protein
MWDLLARLRRKATDPAPAAHDQANGGTEAPEDAAFGTLLADMNAELGALGPTPSNDALAVAPPVITDFDAERDALVIEAAPEAVDALSPDAVTVKCSGEDALVLLDGYPVMQVAGGARTVTPELVCVIATDKPI